MFSDAFAIPFTNFYQTPGFPKGFDNSAIFIAHHYVIISIKSSRYPDVSVIITADSEDESIQSIHHG
jgi:hypothetical protein